MPNLNCSTCESPEVMDNEESCFSCFFYGPPERWTSKEELSEDSLYDNYSMEGSQ